MARNPGFLALRDRVLELARLRASDRLLDIGAGTGLLALAAAPRVERVFALDVSPAMGEHLERKFSCPTTASTISATPTRLARSRRSGACCARAGVSFSAT